MRVPVTITKFLGVSSSDAHHYQKISKNRYAERAHDLICDRLQHYNKSTTNQNPNSTCSTCCGFVVEPYKIIKGHKSPTTNPQQIVRVEFGLDKTTIATCLV